MSDQPAAVDLAVPAYVHPLVDPGFWDRLAAAADVVRFAVVNVHDGPGADLDPAYQQVIGRLGAARVRLLGYVDTDYAARPAAEVVADARTWVQRYGVRGVFLDQVAPGLATLDHYARLAVGVRAAGADVVVANPGTHCHPGLEELANLVVTFEGRWSDYLDYEPPAWAARRPASRFCHLVHAVPAGELPGAPAAAVRRHAGTVFFSDGTGANPWDRLPPDLIAAVPATAAPIAAPRAGGYGWRPRRFETTTDGVAGRVRRRRPTAPFVRLTDRSIRE